MSSSQPKMSYFDQLQDLQDIDDTESLKTYKDGNLFKFMNRESSVLDMTVDNFEPISDEVYQSMLNDVYLRLNYHMKLEKGFLSRLVHKFSDAVVSQFLQSRKYGLEGSFYRLIDSIKLFSSYISLMLFKMFKACELIIDNPIAKPEEIFVAPIVSMIYSCKVKSIDKEYKRKGKNKTISELIQISLKVIHQNISPSWSTNLAKLKSKFGSDMIHPLLQLNEASLENCEAILSKSKKKPRFICSLKKDHHFNGKMTVRKNPDSLYSYILAKKFLLASVESISPFSKAFLLHQAMESIT